MMMLTAEIKKKLPKLGAMENTPADQVPIVVKFFSPTSSWTWYATEFDGEDIFFGLVIGFETELGYFSLKEISEVTGPCGMKVERDLYFTPKPLSELRKNHN